MVTDAAKLLPSNRTSLESVLAMCMMRQIVDAGADLPAGIKTIRPVGFSNWLAAEWWLAEFTPYFADSERLIAAGLPWLKLRGTAAAVKLALSWIDFHAAQLEEDGALLQIDPGSQNAPADLAAIVHLVNASIPAHVKLYRMYHGYDLRQIRLDSSRLDDGLLDDDSGIEIDGITLSFGATQGGTADWTAGPITQARTSAFAGVIPYDDRQLLDAWTLDSQLMHDGRFVMGQLITGTSGDTAATPPTISAHRTIAVSQVVLDGDVVGLDDINSHLGGAYRTLENPFVLDGDRIDSHNLEVRNIIIDAFAISSRQIELQPFARTGTVQVSRNQIYSGTTGQHDTPSQWRSGWDARAWRTEIPSTITFYGA